MATTSGTAQQKSQESPSSQSTQIGGAPSSASGLTRRESSQGLQRRQAGLFSPVVRQMSRINEEIDRLFDSLGFGSLMRMPLEAGFPTLATSDVWSPDVEMFQRENQLVIRADLPGMKRDDVTVEINDDRVVIRGERRQERTQESRGVYRSELSYGAFERVIPLPEGVDADKAQANYHDGVLEITLQAPQTAQAHGRKLEIKEGPPQQSAQTTH